MEKIFLDPTRIYVSSCLAAIESGGVKGLAHITGGGLIENVPRILPNGLGAKLDSTKWPISPVFKWISKKGNILPEEMLKTFNCSLGMIIIADRNKVSSLKKILITQGESVFEVGQIVNSSSPSPTIEFQNLWAPWEK